MAVFSGQAQTAEQIRAWEDARAVFDRFAAADAYVFNIPMWNASVPHALEHCDRHRRAAGLELRLDPAAGYFGLLGGSGPWPSSTSGVYAPGVPAAFGSDFSSTYFADWLDFVGITDATHVRFAPTVVNDDVARARRAAESELSARAGDFAAMLGAREAVSAG